MSKSSQTIHPFDKKTLVQFVIGLFIFVGFLSASFLAQQPQNTSPKAYMEQGR